MASDVTFLDVEFSVVVVDTCLIYLLKGFVVVNPKLAFLFQNNFLKAKLYMKNWGTLP